MAQTQVEGNRVIIGRMQQPLGQIDLEDVAGVNVVDRAADRVEVAIWREVARELIDAAGRMLSREAICRKRLVAVVRCVWTGWRSRSRNCANLSWALFSRAAGWR